MNKLWRDLQKAQETYRYRTYFWCRMSADELGKLLIGASWNQGNAKRRGARRPAGKYRLWSIRSRFVSALRKLGHDVPTELAREHVPYPFRFGTHFRWQRSLSGVTAERRPLFEWYDAWILAAVVYANDGEEPVPLWQVIGTADALNKAMVTRSELELAFGRLVAAGYVRVVPEGFQATSKALALRAPGWPVENVAKAIGASEWSAEAELPRTTDATYVSVEAYAKAEKKYRKEFSKRKPPGSP